LIDADYSDDVSMVVPAGDERSTEEWARAALEGGPTTLRLFIVAGWRFVLWLRLGPRSSADHVLGWKIVGRQPDETVLELRSVLLTARLVFHADGTHIVWSTFVRYERRMAAVIWPPVAMLHRRIVPYALRRAGRRR
jgi:Protein of unknown function (DUF2867)